jgi:hypothetical protein
MTISLVHRDSGKPVVVGDSVRSFRGEDWKVTGWEPPRTANSTGRIHVSQLDGEKTQGFFPSVFNCEWRETL